MNHDGVLERARKRESGLMLSTLLKRVVNYEFDKYTPLVRPLLEERWQGENNYFLTEHRLLVSSDEFPAVGNMVRMLKTAEKSGNRCGRVTVSCEFTGCIS